MPEVQRTTVSGEMTQRFIEFVMMQAQNAAMFLGQIPHPQTGRGEVNLEMARLFIDQLEMIREKTRGNLVGEEEKILTSALNNLHLAYVEIAARMGEPDAFSRRAPIGEPGPDSAGPGGFAPEGGEDFASESSQVAEQPPAPAAPAAPPSGSAAPSGPPEEESHESKRRFVKSYGP